MDKIKQLIRSELLELSAYHVPSAEGMVKLDAMENPYTWPDHIQREWLKGLSEQGVNRYPDPQALLLKQGLRTAMSVPENLDIMLGNGSDELIQIICMALASSNEREDVHNTVLSVEPGFVMYKMVARYLAMDYVGVSLNADDFSIDTVALEQAINEHKPAVIFIAYPNNPTGNLFDDEAIEGMIQSAPGLVVIDEAYQPFAQKSFLDRISQYDNVLLMRTVSKMGLAGLRLGYLIGKPEWLAELDKLRLPYNINILTQFCAQFALRHVDELNKQAQRIRQQRDVLYQALKEIDGLTVYPSAANFVLFRTQADSASRIHEELRKNNILIKNLDNAHPLLKDCCRVTASTPEENKQFLAALKGVV